jgi:DNA-binding MarR family transcriptional regulator
MSLVKDEAADDPHVLALLDAVMGRFRRIVATEEWGGLRASHFRVLGHVPGGGITITDLAERLGMTKQGCGQFVSGMVDLGLLRTSQDPDDGRARVVTLTSAGRRMNERFERRVALVEQEWADAVGSRRYATFRAVLAQLPGTDG